MTRAAPLITGLAVAVACGSADRPAGAPPGAPAGAPPPAARASGPPLPAAAVGGPAAASAVSVGAPPGEAAAGPALPAASAERAPPRAPPVAGTAPDQPPEPPAPPLLPALVRVPGDAPARVTHGAPGVARALVYLHGVCGDITALDRWSSAARPHFTVIALQGDTPCAERGRYRWSAPVATLQGRIDRALDAVRQARGGALDPRQVAVFGYSQGATRAVALLAAAPERYPWVVLGSPPTAPDPRVIPAATRTVVLFGAREAPELGADIERALLGAGRAVTRASLPGAGHGQYGPDAERVVGEALAWLVSG